MIKSTSMVQAYRGRSVEDDRKNPGKRDERMKGTLCRVREAKGLGRRRLELTLLYI